MNVEAHSPRLGGYQEDPGGIVLGIESFYHPQALKHWRLAIESHRNMALFPEYLLEEVQCGLAAREDEHLVPAARHSSRIARRSLNRHESWMSEISPMMEDISLFIFSATS